VRTAGATAVEIAGRAILLFVIVKYAGGVS
jgi:hypothetical protein